MHISSLMLESRSQVLVLLVSRYIPAALALIICLLSSPFCPGTVQASTLAETRGMGARAMAMGGAFTAVADDVSATYYNPAGLAQIRGNYLHEEYIFVIPRVYLTEGQGPRRLFLDKPTKAPMVALVTDLSRIIKLPRRLVVGWNVYFPDNFKSAWKARYGIVNYDPYYPLYGDGHEEQGIGIWASLGFEIFPWLLAGAGFNFMLHAQRVEAALSFDTALEPVKEEAKLTIDITTEIFPILGILVKPTENLRLGFTWREEGELVFGGGGGIKLLASLYLGPGRSIPIPLPLTIPILSHFRPRQFTLGASYQIRENLLLSADLTYYEWSRYRDGAERYPDPPLKKILVPRIGTEFQLREDLALRAGYSFQPSPLPQQNPGYHTNFLDNDVHTLSTGFGYFWQVFGFPEKPAQLSVFYQLHILVPRTFQNVHPGGEGLRSSGLFHCLGLGLCFSL